MTLINVQTVGGVIEVGQLVLLLLFTRTSGVTVFVGFMALDALLVEPAVSEI